MSRRTKKSENFDCTACGQDLRLPADAPERLSLLAELASLAHREHDAPTREIADEDHSYCEVCRVLARPDALDRAASPGKETP